MSEANSLKMLLRKIDDAQVLASAISETTTSEYTATMLGIMVSELREMVKTIEGLRA